MIQWLKSRWQILLALVICFLIPWCVLQSTEALDPMGDSWTYTQLAKVFEEQGLFDFAAYAQANGNSFRGVVFPWIIALCNRTMGYEVWNCLLMAYVFAVALPRLMELVFSVKIAGWRRPLVAGLFTLLFQGLVVYVLTDLWAAALAIAAMTALLEGTRMEETALWKRLLFLGASGLCLALAYNIRTIYLLLWMTAAVCLLILMLVRRQLRWPLRLLWPVALAVGLLAGSLPQMMVNQYAFHQPSPLLLSDNGANLFANQLYNGIYEQKYETNGNSEYWDDGLDFLDPAGLEILEREAMTPEFRFEEGAEYLPGVGDYLALVLQHPLDFAGILGRHLVNMLDIRYPMIFLEDTEPNPLYPAVNYPALYLGLAAFVLWMQRMKKQEVARTLILPALLLPTLAICAGAVEPRFGVMLQLVLWACLCYLPDRKMLHGLRVRDWVLLAAGLVLFICGMTAIGGSAMMNLEDYPILYQ